MAIGFVAQGTTPSAAGAGTGSTSVTPAAPTLNNTNLVLIEVKNKPDTATPSTPAGWTLVGTVAGGTGSVGADTGPVRQTVFSRVKDAGWSSMPAITVTGASASTAQAFSYSATTGLWDVAATSGADTTTGAAWSVTGATNPGIEPADLMFVASAIPTDVTTPAQFTAELITATGVSAWGTMSELSEPETTTGNQVAGFNFHRPVTTGTATAPPVVTATVAATNTNVAGVSLIVRMREITAKAGTESPAITISDSSSANKIQALGVLIAASATPLTGQDLTLSNILTARGHTVTPALSTAALPTTGYDVIVITESGAAGSQANIDAPTCPLPVVNLETTWNTMRFSSAGGTTPASAQTLDIIANSHPIVAGIPDPVTFRSSSGGIYGVASGTLAAGVVNIAEHGTTAGHVIVASAEKGAVMTSGNAPARRVMLGTGTGGSGVSAWTADGQAIFYQAVEWAGTYPPVTASDSAAITIAESSSIVSLFTATNRANVPASSAATSRGSGTFTPSADSKLYVFSWTENNTAANFTMSITDSVGLTWTQKAFQQITSLFRPTFYLWEADVGGSPVSMSVTINSTSSANITMDVFDVVGANPRIKAGQLVTSIAANGANYVTGTLPAAATANNLSIELLGINTDAFITPPTPASWNLLAKSPAGGAAYEKNGVFYRNDFTGTSTTVASTGENLSYGTVLFEIEATPATTPISGSESTAITISDTSAVFKQFSSTDGAAITATEAVSIQTSSQNLTVPFDDSSYTSTFSVSGDVAPVVASGKISMTMGTVGKSFTQVTSFPKKYTLNNGESYTFEVLKWAPASRGNDDFAIYIYGWDSLTIDIAGGVSSLGGVTTISYANADLVKYIVYTNTSGTLSVTLKDSSGVTLASSTGTMPANNAATLGFETYFVPNGSGTDTFEIEGLYPGIGGPSATPVSGSESTAITISDSSSLAITDAKSATDTTAITISDVSAPQKGFSSTDTSAITISESVATAVSVATTDGAAVSVAETSAVAVSLPTTDTTAITIADISNIGSTLPGTDSAAVSVAEQTSFVNTQSAADTTAISVAESVAVQVGKTGVETPSISIADTSSVLLSDTKSASDTTAVSISETAANAVTQPASDTSAITVSEFAVTFVTLSATDTSAVSVAETAGNAVAQATSDTGSIAVSESTATSGTVTANDTNALTITDSSSVFQGTDIPGQENVSISVTEISGLVKTIPTTDTSSSTIAESVALTVTQPATDTSAVSVAETSAVVVALSATDISSVAVSETTDAFKTLTANDTTAVAAGDVATSTAVTQPAVDAAAVSVVDSSASALSVATSDTGAVSVNDVGSASIAIATTDTGALSVSDIGSVSTSLPGTDSSAVSVTETASIFITFSTTDTSAVSVDDSAATTNAFSATDTSSISVAETAGNLLTKAATDTGAITITEDPGVVAGIGAFSAADTAAVSVAETATVAISLNRTDTVAITVTEAVGQAGNQPGTDAAAISITETAVIFQALAAADTASINVSDSPSLAIIAPQSANDTAALSVTESPSILVAVQSGDIFALSVAEAISENVSLNAIDSTAISVTEAKSQQSTFSRTDTAAIGVTESAQVVIGVEPQSATDAAALSVTESVTTLVLITSYDYGSIAGGEGGPATGGSQAASDTVSLHVVETASLHVSTTGTDESTIGLSESVAILLVKSAIDSLTIGVVESTSGQPQEANLTFVFVYINGAWVRGQAAQWHNGAWYPCRALTYSEGEWVDDSA